MAGVIDPKILMGMKPHEEMCLTEDKDKFGSNRMMRVDGGWIYWRTTYTKKDQEDPRAIAGVFVPESKQPPKQN